VIAFPFAHLVIKAFFGVAGGAVTVFFQFGLGQFDRTPAVEAALL
jgi:hypothetical protein